ncbi:MAG: lipopolysaccharide biosynthesis protein [Rudaea sp.]
MSRLRDSVIANYVGQVWMALMGAVFVPLYIRALGMEAFGLVGLMLSIQAFSILLDLGMGGVLNRELARRAHNTGARTLGHLVRTFEWLVWPIALAIAVVIWLASGPLANHWLHPDHLTRAETANAIAIMGLAVALQWPSSFYSNGLSGLERQTVMNVINAGFATLRGPGVLVVLFWGSPTIVAFMWWYAAMGACQSLVSAAVLWHVLPADPNHRPRFLSEEIRATGRFAGGLFAITALSVAVTQLDRIVLSAMRPLVELGYFSLALSVSAGMGKMIQPMFNALYPRFSRLVAANDEKALIELYHLSNQCLVVVIAAVSAVLMVFSKDVIYLWTGDAGVATTAAMPLSILVAGTALNGLMNLPYALQLAHGWTRLAIGTNLAALILGIPFCIWAVGHYGIVGAAFLWLVINVGYVAICIPLMHRRLMRGEMSKWYLQDTLPPFIAAAAVAGLSRWMIPNLSGNVADVLLLACISSAALAAAALAAPSVRQLIQQHFMQSASAKN